MKIVNTRDAQISLEARNVLYKCMYEGILSFSAANSLLFKNFYEHRVASRTLHAPLPADSLASLKATRSSEKRFYITANIYRYV